MHPTSITEEQMALLAAAPSLRRLELAYMAASSAKERRMEGERMQVRCWGCGGAQVFGCSRP